LQIDLEGGAVKDAGMKLRPEDADASTPQPLCFVKREIGMLEQFDSASPTLVATAISRSASR